jgi:outer membrane scaffolding protein for murein synthesis (MipA/OmpV family)
MVSLGMNGLSAYWRHENLRVGGGLTYNLGRTQSNGIFGQSDSRLNGMGDIPAALGLRGFADYRLGFVDLNASITKLTASGNDGVLVNFGVAMPYKLTDDTAVTARVWATWADQSYTETFFGVTSTQAANSGFRQYAAGAGIKDVGIAVGVNHKLDQHWIVSLDAQVTRLTGDAANSPIVFSKTQAMFLSAVKYHF